jgi:copper chaperone CopZ
MKSKGSDTRQGVLDVQGANCPSCAFTIEKLGRKVRGVTEVRVDVTRNEIRVDYDGAPGTLESIAGIVGRLGYQASSERPAGTGLLESARRSVACAERVRT